MHLRSKRQEVALGSVYKSHLPPELVKHVTEIINNPDGMGAKEELATAKALAGNLMKALAGAEGGLGDPKHALLAIQAMDKITTIAEKQAKISEKQDAKLGYKQVLVLISATVEKLLMQLGRNDDAKQLFLTILPDLPWPAGVARVTGAEGLIGQKGQLLLPAKPAEKKLKVDAGFEGLDIQHVSEEEELKLAGPLAPPSHLWNACQYVPKINKMNCPEDNFVLYEDPEPAEGTLDFRAPQESDSAELL